MNKSYYVYIITNKTNTTLYIGITYNLTKRVWQHKQKLVEGFSQKYNLNKLIYYEQYTNVFDAIVREKRLKKWRRVWKENLINEHNAEWKDLSESII